VTISLATRLQLDSHVRFRRYDDEGVVVNQTSAEALVLNDVAARLVEVSDGSRTLRECADLISGEFDAAPEIVREDVLRFAAELVDAGVARAIESGP